MKPSRDGARTRSDYERGLPGYHDPTAGIGGAAPARSALTLRAWLAAFGVVMSVSALVLFLFLDAAGFAIAMGALALFAAIDLGWVLHRKRRGEPG